MGTNLQGYMRAATNMAIFVYQSIGILSGFVMGFTLQ